jgi:hypothetical protein
MAENPFVGAWRLVSCEYRSMAGEVINPFGENPFGYLLYTEDGYMSATIMSPDRPNFSSEDIRGGTSEEKAVAYDTYLSYAGRYEIRGEKVIHHAEVSLTPNQTGKPQERFWEFEGDRLSLRTAPILLVGALRTARLVWERAKL